MEIKFKKLHDIATIPHFATDDAAGMDLRAIENMTLMRGEHALVKTGIAVEIPHGFVGLVCPRSGLALNRGVTVLNAPGIIDSDYRGDVGVILINHNSDVYNITAGDRIAQLLIMPVCNAANSSISIVDELSDTTRSAGGFGSTGI